MLSEEKIKELREILQKAQNPVFFFDNDVDGLASFLLLRRFCEKGKGVVIKSFPELSTTYSRKIDEFNPDYVFVLDKPLIEEGFRNACREKNIPLIWIDHHPIVPYGNEQGIEYFNPLSEKQKENEPTTHMCYRVVNKKDSWIALLGCVADWYVPEFFESVQKEYPDLIPKTQSAAKILYESEFGKIITILSFALKDRTSNVVRMIKNLTHLKSPREILDQTSKTMSIHKRYNQIQRKYQKLIDKAKQLVREKAWNRRLLFFQYGGDLSLSSELANELHYLYPQHLVVVAYIKGTKTNCSIRGKNARDLTEKALKNIKSTSGGHEEASGATIPIESLPKFRDNLFKLLM